MASQKHKQPWTVEGVPWKSESAFWAWVRGGLRKLWSKHPVKLEYIKQHRKQILNPNPRGKKETIWGMTCSKCGKEHVQSNIEIDHISETGGKFTCLDDIKDYAAYLFLIDFDSIRPVCSGCHAIITNAQRKGISFEESAADKKVIALMKEPKENQLAFIQQAGYNTETLTNSIKRREAIQSILQEQTNVK